MAEKQTIAYHVDQMKTTFFNLMIQGWAVGVDDKTGLYAEDAKGKRLDVYIERLEREDVNAIYHMENGCLSGFHVILAFKNIVKERIYLVFESGRRKKRFMIEMKNIQPSYDGWFRRQRPTRSELREQKKVYFAQTPLFSIVIPLYHTPKVYLKEIINSVLGQTYANLELCLADGSSDNETEKFITRHYRRESRIKYMRLKKNRGISENTNRALMMAAGDFIVFADHDDVLEEDALYEMVKAYNENPDIEMMYTDEDKINQTGTYHFEPHLKPDFDMDLLEGNNYFCHLLAVKRELVKRAGDLRSEYDGAQDYDFVLRCCEVAKAVHHIPRVLYHWRVHPDSTAGNMESKDYASLAGQKALQDHFRRCGQEVQVECTDMPGRYHSRWKIQEQPLVSILIPNKDHVEELQVCVNSILEKTSYPAFEIIIIENNSTGEKTFRWYEEIERNSKVRRITWDGVFDYAAIHNWAVQQAKGEYLLFLNNDTEVITEGWIEEMLSHCLRTQVGAVGVKLYYPDETIQHIGVVTGFGGVAGHILSGSKDTYEIPVPAMLSVHQASAVTAACMMTKKSLYSAVGGMDETFAVAYNDIDYCLKLSNEGKTIVVTPHAKLIHYESRSRGLDDTPEKKQRLMAEGRKFEAKWQEVLNKGDPYFNQQLYEAAAEYEGMKFNNTYWNKWSV